MKPKQWNEIKGRTGLFFAPVRLFENIAICVGKS